MKNKTTMLLAGGLAVVLILFAAAAIYFGMIVKDRSGSQLPEETEKPVMVEQGGQEKTAGNAGTGRRRGRSGQRDGLSL